MRDIEEKRIKLRDFVSPDWYIENYEYWDKKFNDLEDYANEVFSMVKTKK